MAGSAFLSAMAVLAVPGMIREDRSGVFIGAAVVLLAAGLITLGVGRIDRRGAHVLAVVALACGLVLVISVADSVGQAIGSTWFVLVPMFMSTSLSRREVAAYGAVSTVCAVLLVATLPSPDVRTATVRGLVIVGAVALPITYFLVLRRELDVALADAREQSLRDALTGLLNRRGLAEGFDVMIPSAARNRAVVALLVCDVDHFKRINDTLGHPVGDEVLRQVAATTVGCVRPADLVGRLGGEELAVVAVVPRPEEAAELAERLRLAVQTHCARWNLTVSIGVATASSVPSAASGSSAPELADLLARADVELYRAKDAGRNRVMGPAADIASSWHDPGAHTRVGGEPQGPLP